MTLPRNALEKQHDVKCIVDSGAELHLDVDLALAFRYTDMDIQSEITVDIYLVEFVDVFL